MDDDLVFYIKHVLALMLEANWQMPSNPACTPRTNGGVISSEFLDMMLYIMSYSGIFVIPLFESCSEWVCGATRDVECRQM